MRISKTHLLQVAAIAFALVGAARGVGAQAVPLVAAYAGQTANGKLIDAGPLRYDGQMQNVEVVADGHPGPAWRFNGAGSVVTIDGPFMQKLATAITLCAWIKVERFPPHAAFIIAKGGNQGFQLGIGDNHAAFFHGLWGGWYDGPWGGQIAPHEWTHVAFTFKLGLSTMCQASARRARWATFLPPRKPGRWT